MPIRPELRHFYRGQRWAMTRARILARTGGRFTLLGEYLGGAACERCRRIDGDSYFNWATGRDVTVQIGVAHLKHMPRADERDDELAALCRRCHLLYDADHHTFNRMARKDGTRPLLREMSA
jgi:hypothetical protein